MTVSSHGNGADRDHEAIREWPGRHGPVSAIACCAPRMAEVMRRNFSLSAFRNCTSFSPAVIRATAMDAPRIWHTRRTFKSPTVQRILGAWCAKFWM